MTYRHTVAAGPLLAFACDLARLADSWGIPEGVRVMVTLSDPVSDEAVLWMMPFNSLFDGLHITWDYEAPGELFSHQLVMMLPATWLAFSQARTDNDHLKLADMYMTLGQAIRPLNLTERDYFGLAIAEYESAIAARPDDPALYLLKALAYRAGAESQPSESLNYELLAAHELEIAHSLAPDDVRIAENLARTYYATALASAKQGDETLALKYLELASSSGLPEIVTDEKLQNLALEWSITLAEKGNFQIAFDQGEKLLPPNLLQLLQDYAPPFTSIQTQVSTDPGLRHVKYQIVLYSPSAAQTVNQLHTLLNSLTAIQDVEATLAANDSKIELELNLRYNTLDDLTQHITDINSAFEENKNLLSLALKVPWNSIPEQLESSSGRLSSRYQYREQIDGSALQQSWLEQSQYAQWRLAEVAKLPSADDLTQLQQRLANYMLRQQQQVWRQLPTYSLWTYRVALGQENASQGEWIITWGQNRILEINSTVYNTTMLRRFTIVGLVIAVLIVLALLVPWKYLKRANG